MDPPGGGGFLRPGAKSGSAFGVSFDRPPARPGGKQRADGGNGRPGLVHGTKRPRLDGRAQPSPGSDTSSSSSDADDVGDAPGPSGRLFDGGVRGPDLPPMNPTYRYGDPSLPVSRYRRQMLWLVETHAVTIIAGETGSGKTTQVPQFLYEAGWAEGGYAIAVTQPRRVAAVSVAGRVAEEMGAELGGTVGYAVRFDSAVQQGRTRIKYLTDGLLLREMLDDPLLTSYSVIMVDEAHERSLATDMLLGLLKKVLRRRSDLRLIISSATLEAERLRAFFDTATTAAAATAATVAAAAASRGGGGGGGGAGAAEVWVPGSEPRRSPAILSVEGRTHPVQVHYLESPAPDYVAAAVEAAVDIHREDVPGDILVFLTGQEEVERAVSQLAEAGRRLGGGGGGGGRGYGSTRLLPLPLYAGLPGPQQAAALRPAPRGVRKVVVATNVAETSLTIEGVMYVIDCCFVKLRAYNPLTGLEALLPAPLSAASAAQRAGRAGRVRAGHCLRLATERDFARLAPPFAVPEMQRSPLTGLVLQLKALGVDNVMRFEWLAPPPAEAMVRALEELHALRALDDDARLTRDVGLPLSLLPLPPPLAAALLASRALGCTEELLTAVALMEAGGGGGGGGAGGQGVWVQGSPRALDEARSRFAAAEGDAVTLLNVHRAWTASGRSAAWAHRHCLHPGALRRADEAREALLALLRRHGVLRPDAAPPSCGGDMEPVCRALASGLFLNAAVLEGTHHDPTAPEGDPGCHVYRLLRRTQGASQLRLRVHPGSVLRRTPAPCLVFAGVAASGDGRWAEMVGVTAVRPQWLAEAAPHVFAAAPGREGGA